MVKLVYVEWWDSCGPGFWTMAHDISPEMTTVESVGWVLTETDAAIVLGSHNGAEQTYGPLTIPKCAIKRQIELTVPAPEGAAADEIESQTRLLADHLSREVR